MQERKGGKRGGGRGREAREVEVEDRAHFRLYLLHLLFSISPLPTTLPAGVVPFGIIPDEKGVGNGGKESKRGKRRRT